MKLATIFIAIFMMDGIESLSFRQKMFRKHHGIAQDKMRRRSSGGAGISSKGYAPRFDMLSWRLMKENEAFRLAEHHSPLLDEAYVAKMLKRYISKFA